MNPLIAQQLARIERAAKKLEAILDDQERAIAEQREAREELTQRYWAQGQRLAVLDAAEQDFERVRQENERLKRAHRDLRQRLGAVLDTAKGLQREFRR